MVTFYKQDKMPKVSPIQTTKEKTAKVTVRDDNLEMIPNIKIELVTSWKDETWIIESEPLGKLAPVLERRFNMDITFESDEIMNYKFNGRIQNETIEQILMAIELSAPIQYRFEKNRIILSANKMRKERYDKFTN
jgi:ferric-dicitrate binding protein FerR (iron transport regulator)